MQPDYTDIDQAQRCFDQIKHSPALVCPSDVLKLRQLFSLSEQGKIFLLQAGDCAESFAECIQEKVTEKIDFLLRLKNALEEKIKKPVFVIGRIAGQYAKPRTEKAENRNGVVLPNYCGDIFNGFEFDFESRQHDPKRLLLAYECSWKTTQWIQNQIFTSHEALLLGYESALTRLCPDTHRYFNLSAHSVWLGERTKALDGAHVEYLRGIENPIGIKLGPNTSEMELIKLIRVLNPHNEKGKINLITRMGVSATAQKLSDLVRCVQKEKRHVSWSVDPMHGNTKKTLVQLKTRDFQDIVTEFQLAWEVHQKCHSFLGGVHLEITPSDVTECTGGSQQIKESDLQKNYLTLCDPRLNQKQSFDFIQSIEI